MNVEALASAGLLDRQIFLGRRPASDRPRGVRRMHGVHEQRRLVRAKRIQEVVVGRDERLLLLGVELAPDDFRLVIFEAKPMQQGDQPRAAFIDDAELLLDIGADLARRARQCRGDPGFQRFFLRLRKMAGAAAALKARQTFDAAFAIELGPTAHGVVVEIENLGDLFAAQAVVQKQHGVRAARQPMRSRPVSHQSDKGGAVWRRKEAGANHAPRRIDF